MLADAARVLAAAQRFLEAAAVFERMGGADWQLIGAILDVSPHTARVCFAVSEAAFREELFSPEGTRSGGAAEEASRLRAHMAREPLETALDLDDWVLRHEDGDSDLGTAPVSETHRQAADPGEEVGVDTTNRPGDLEPGGEVAEREQHLGDLQPRQVCADAVMRTVPERDVLVRRPVEFLLAVGRARLGEDPDDEPVRTPWPCGASPTPAPSRRNCARPSIERARVTPIGLRRCRTHRSTVWGEGTLSTIVIRPLHHHPAVQGCHRELRNETISEEGREAAPQQVLGSAP
ncbi:hypothetical protein [Streptomyces sp. NPDC005799]|uniref:hypothetical protein n=1 Tax=Streptomyces sp. NPDC005799 TaxID=3154678 RepID=UPI0033D70674